MRKIILIMHASLDGFVGGPNGEMDWIKFDDDLFGFVGTFTEDADTALYSRVTWEMMENYWPTAGDKPNAGKHDIDHSNWYKKVDKVVLSRSMRGKQHDKTRFLSDNVPAEIEKIKQQPGKNILLLGSPTAVHLLTQHQLIDEYWIFVNPIIIGEGIPLFKDVQHKMSLKPLSTKSFPCGVTALSYSL
jgi:dihydrofolate reductase